MENLIYTCTRQYLVQKISNNMSGQEKYIVYFEIMDFHSINELYGFIKADMLLRQVVDVVHKYLSDVTKGEYGIQGQGAILVAVDSHDLEVIKGLINEVISTKYEYELVFRVAYVKMEQSDEIISAVENIPKLIGRERYIFKGNPYEQYDIKDELHRYGVLKADLLSGIGENFVIYYQPQVDVKTKHITSCEILSRWKHPALGMILPYEFMAIIRDLRMDYKFDLAVLDKACSEIKSAMRLYIKEFSVNVSLRTILHSDVADQMYEIVTKYDLDPRDITLEITEEMEETESELISRNIQNLIERGFKISIDDFGTGYSSYYRLSSIPFCEVKVPREFLLLSSHKDQNKNKTILEAIISLCKNLNCRIVMEGVETLSDLRLMEYLEVDSIQGYFYSKPLEKEDYKSFIRNYRVV